MSGGSSVPYSLRQNKFVDRRIFVDLLSRIERYAPIEDHVYVSMGGATLEDHRLAHAELGLCRLLSFDSQQWIIDRQKFNKPVDYIKLKRMTSSELIGSFSATMNELGWGGAPNVAMWLDFTAPAQLGAQIREYNQLLDLLQPKDIVRITVNASSSAIYKPITVDGRPEVASVFRPKRLERLTAKLGEYMPAGVSAGDMTDDGLPVVIASAMEIAAKAAFPSGSKHVALPLSVVRYADGQQMLSVTAIVLERTKVRSFFAKTKAKSWPFFSKSWQDIRLISVPDLTMRERMFITERIPTKSEMDICTDLGFLFENDAGVSQEYVRQYRQYYRFYPHFHHVIV